MTMKILNTGDRLNQRNGEITKETMVLELKLTFGEADKYDETIKIGPCVVCLVNAKEILNIPCSHLCICRTCLKAVNNKCSVCRSNISKQIRVFF